jgi:hypothetical protein
VNPFMPHSSVSNIFIVLMYYSHTICYFLAYYSELCIIISNIRLDVTIGHIRKKDANKKAKKMN